ncbi:MAG TPA: flagellar biosynthesis protein FlhA [Burkholderiaceae bacterium]|nr:flagellar biosynthesis protein FlhA [Burkholderiaceae bacterium]
MMQSLRKALGSQADLVLVALVVGILIVLFAPIPSALLDLLILANVSFALLILLLTFYMPKPVEFSTFPSLLLVATLFRLSLNIAATRLILSDADAGHVIGAIGSFVVGGNYVIGLIVFLILVVVQYVVVTSGAQRVSEVAARFTLDSMPGQQMSIDADLNMGFIDQAEAMRRRKLIEKEAGFYGAMDGASKFVKGDAIAGIVIMLINIIGGLVIGVMQQGMPWAEALRTFTLLTIGDGIVTQVPALVIAVGTGIIVTRSSADANLSAEVFRQLTSFPRTLVIVVLALLGMLALPGIPAWPVLVLIAGLSATAYAMRRKKGDAAAGGAEASAETAQAEDVYESLAVEAVEVRLGDSLVPLVNDAAGMFMERVNAFRKQYALESGFVVPTVRFKDDRALADDAYEIRVFGSTVGTGSVKSGQTLAIHAGGELKKLPGLETRDPTYGLPAFWIKPEDRELARASRFTLVDPETVLLTHLNELLRQQSAALLTRAQTSTLLDRVRQRQAGLVDELIPSVLSLSEVQKVLQGLLREKVSIRNLEMILEVLVDSGRSVKDAHQLTELVRQGLAPSICQPLIAESGYMHVLTFDPAVEQSLAKSLRALNGPATLVLEPRFAEQLLSGALGQVERMMKASMVPVLLCAPELRRHVRALTERLMPHLRVLALTEVPNNVSLKAYGSIGTGLQIAG